MNSFKDRFPNLEAWRNASLEEKRQAMREMLGDLQAAAAVGELDEGQRAILHKLKHYLMPELPAVGNGHNGHG